MAKHRLPNILIVGGKRHKLAVFLVQSKLPDGTPKICSLLEEKRAIDLAGGEEFFTAYVPSVMFEKRR